MNGPHDLGGAHGFGPVAPEPHEPRFHAEWERRVLALTLAMGNTGAWNIDMTRHARERIPPAEYLAASYYEKWLLGLERLLVERGLATAAEIEAGRSLAPPAALLRTIKAAEVPGILARGTPYDRPPTSPALFGEGESVRARVMNPTGHTRIPRYARGRSGTIARVHGVHVFPDARSAGPSEDPHWLYSVAFDAAEVWGPQGRAGDLIHVDLWEPYLERL